MRAFVRLLLGAAVFLTTTVTATAATITYVHTGSGSGTLDGTPFGAAAPVPFTILATGDTANIESCGGGCLFNDNLAASITITGLGTFDFVTATRYFFNPDFDLVGFSRAGLTGADLFNGPIVPGGVWDMASSIGPIVGDAELLQWGFPPFDPVNTTGGVLVFNNAEVEGATFTARVPEPVTLLLFGVGALYGLRRRSFDRR